jgi:hypothetical protein
MLFHLEPKTEIVVFLELLNLLQSFPFNELPYRPAVGNFEEVGFKVVVGESEVKKLFGILLHLFEFILHSFLEIFADVRAKPKGQNIRNHIYVVLNFVIISLFK